MNFRLSTLSSAILCIVSIGNTQAEAVHTSTEASEIQSNVIVLPTIVIVAVKSEEVGQQIFDKAQLESVPNTQKTITDFLKVNPDVQFGNSTMAGGTQGELDAPDISIHGAMFYENKFLLNNVNIGNTLNPAETSDAVSGSMQGSSLNANINTDLICELEVLESNVSAAYGGFTGGVIKAKTCAPETEIGAVHGSLNYDYTSSDWTRFNYVNDDEKAEFDHNTDAKYQKDFVKQGLSATGYGRVSEATAINLSAARRQSDIQLKSDFAEQQNYTQTRQEDNFSGNIYHEIDQQHKLTFGLHYQNSEKKKYNAALLNSSYLSNLENIALDAEHEYRFDGGVLTQSIVLQKQDNHRDSSANTSTAWNKSPAKNWDDGLQNEGGFGDLSMLQDSWEYQLQSVFDPVIKAGLMHSLSVGAGYRHAEAEWKRPEDVYMYYVPSKAYGGLGTSTCTLADGTVDAFCDLTYVGSNGLTGQYNATRSLYAAGQVQAKNDSGYAFIEDQMSWDDHIKVRLGMRVDYSSISKHANWAPRSNIQYFPFADERLGLTAGYNRYYADNAFYTQLQDSINALQFRQTRKDLDAAWISDHKISGTNVQRSQLDTPYSDETVFAIHSTYHNWMSQLKYVHRDYKDQIRRTRISLSPIVDQYDNTGKSTADTYTFSLSNLSPIAFLRTQNRFNVGVDYTDIERNFNNYDDNTFIDLSYQQYILYNGSVIDESTRPASNFAQPWTLRLGWSTEFDAFPLKISQLFRYRSDRDAIVRSNIPVAERPIAPNGEMVKSSYAEQSIGSAINWDVRASYDFEVGRSDKLTIGLTVNNILNRLNKYAAQSDSTQSNNGSSGVYAESGRQFVADISYKF